MVRLALLGFRELLGFLELMVTPPSHTVQFDPYDLIIADWGHDGTLQQ
jgi:hypothetical protein